MTAPNMPPEVKAAFAAFPDPARGTLMQARTLIFEAAGTTGAGPLTETLKWGEPAYLTEKTKSGSTIRLGTTAGDPAAFFICSTRLVDGFRADFGETLTCDGNRAVMLDDAALDPGSPLSLCFARALTYHSDKRCRS